MGVGVIVAFFPWLMYKDVEGRKRIKEIRGLNADGRVEIEERGFLDHLIVQRVWKRA